MQFPDVETMSPKDAAVNQVAANALIRGKYYTFTPAVEATGVPTGGEGTCELAVLKFERGWYIGYKNGQHIFQGKPVNDTRVIPPPPGYRSSTETACIVEQLRECYFHVLFIGGGPQAVLDPDQSHK